MSILARFLRESGVPAESVTAENAYAFLVERGNALGISASWFNVTYHAVVAWLTMRGLPTDLRGLRPQRVAVTPPRWFTADEVRRLWRRWSSGTTDFAEARGSSGSMPAESKCGLGHCGRR